MVSDRSIIQAEAKEPRGRRFSRFGGIKKSSMGVVPLFRMHGGWSNCSAISSLARQRSHDMNRAKAAD